MKNNILKVQLGIFSFDYSVMVYNEDHSISYIDEHPERDLVRILERNDYKMFYYYELKNKTINLKEIAPYQKW